MKRIAILQSNYIPWKGYFDIIRNVDEFILFDSVQYTRRDWRNRNQIKTRDGVKWLTIPVNVKGQFFQRIDETTINDFGWAENHWKTISNQYAHAPFFRQYQELFADLYQRAGVVGNLSTVNRMFIEAVCDILKIKTIITCDTNYEIPEGKNERLIGLCRQAGGNVYLSGPSAKDYVDESLFEQAGIKVEWMNYSGYPEYPQPYPPFTHGVTILDLIFNTGDRAPDYMKEIKP